MTPRPEAFDDSFFDEQFQQARMEWYQRRFGTTPEQSFDERIAAFVKRLALLGVSGIEDSFLKNLGVEPEAMRAHLRVMKALEKAGFQSKAEAMRQTDPVQNPAYQVLHAATEGSRVFLNRAKQAVALAGGDIVGPAIGKAAKIVGIDLKPETAKRIGKASEFVDFIPDDLVGMGAGLVIKELSKAQASAIELAGVGKKTIEFVAPLPGKALGAASSIIEGGANFVDSLPQRVYGALDYVLGLSELKKIINDFPGWPWEQTLEPVTPSQPAPMGPVQAVPAQPLVAEAVPVAA